MKQNCEINKDELNSSIDSMSDIIDYVTYLLQTFYSIVSLKLFADILREKLGKK